MEKLVLSPQGLKQKAAGEKRQHREVFKKLRRLKDNDLDARINDLHHKFMDRMDCLSCANCCKSISPAMSGRDVERIARYLRKKPSQIVEEFMKVDQDGDYVFRSQPCPFLGEDNYCSVYEARPNACREYPHTDRKRQGQILDITYQNISVCPVVFELVQELKNTDL